jgi:hypothetical protein
VPTQNTPQRVWDPGGALPSILKGIYFPHYANIVTVCMFSVLTPASRGVTRFETSLLGFMPMSPPVRLTACLQCTQHSRTTDSSIKGSDTILSKSIVRVYAYVSRCATDVMRLILMRKASCCSPFDSDSSGTSGTSFAQDPESPPNLCWIITKYPNYRDSIPLLPGRLIAPKSTTNRPQIDD